MNRTSASNPNTWLSDTANTSKQVLARTTKFTNKSSNQPLLDKEELMRENKK
tara:strand:- start:437 stop:592 length:156 start_codon:yes stop_codon:yes gene_type:complete